MLFIEYEWSKSKKTIWHNCFSSVVFYFLFYFIEVIANVVCFTLTTVLLSIPHSRSSSDVNVFNIKNNFHYYSIEHSARHGTDRKTYVIYRIKRFYCKLATEPIRWLFFATSTWYNCVENEFINYNIPFYL